MLQFIGIIILLLVLMVPFGGFIGLLVVTIVEIVGFFISVLIALAMIIFSLLGDIFTGKAHLMVYVIITIILIAITYKAIKSKR